MPPLPENLSATAGLVHPPGSLGQDQTLLSLFEERVKEAPGDPALTFLRDGTTIDGILSRSDVKTRALRIAKALHDAGGVAGDRVLVILPEGLLFLPAFLGCLYAGMIAVPLPVPDAVRGRRAAPRFSSIAADADARLVITAKPIADTLPESLPGVVILADEPGSGIPETLPSPRPDTVAYLQYTSGSTGSPRGVIITHGNVLGHIRAAQHIMGYREHDRVLTWMPHTHDFGLVEGLLRPLVLGAPIFLMTPKAFLRDPGRWLRAISTLRITHAAAAAFAFQYCLSVVTDDDLEGLDLSSWWIATCGAEPVRAELMETFVTRFARWGLRNTTLCPAYGLAEATLMVTATGGVESLHSVDRRVDNRNVRLTACGGWYDDTDVRIVDGETLKTVRGGELGEIWVAGSAVAPGYWQKQDETAAVFGWTLPDGDPNRRYLRTGDLGFVQEGQLFISGRLKDLVIVNGQNYVPSDLEWCLDDAHPLLAGGTRAAFAIPADNDDASEHLAIACEIGGKSAAADELAAAAEGIRQAIARDFHLTVQRVFLLKRGEIPKTTSGKVQRRACREGLLGGQLQPLYEFRVAPQQPPMAASTAGPRPGRMSADLGVRTAWFEVLGSEPESADSDFFHSGGDSIKVVGLLARIEALTGVELDLADLAQQTTTARLIEIVARAQSSGPRLAAPVRVDSDDQPELREALSQIVEPDASQTMRDLRSRPPLESRLERWLTRLPFSLASAALRHLVRQAWARERYWRVESDLIRRFHASLRTPVALDDLMGRSLYYNLMNRYALDLSATGLPATRTSPRTRLEGVELLEEARRQGRGVLVAAHHSLASCWLPKAETDRITRHIVFGVDGLRGAERLSREQQTLLYARQFEHAAGLLSSGGVVLLAPDGFQAHGRRIAFHGRARPVSAGLGALAGETGCVVIQAFSEISATDDLRFVLSRRLPLSATLPDRAAFVAHLEDDYYAGLEEVWSRLPWTVFFSDMRAHLARPIVS